MKNQKTLRHTKTNEGFTLIELLVVILIIAILAAVGIVALLSALNSGRKSSATTVLRNGITALRAEQARQGTTTFSGVAGIHIMNAAEPDITWLAADVEATAGENSISIRNVSGTGQVYIASKSEKNVCYHARLDPATGAVKSTTYASEAGGTCSANAGVSLTSTAWKDTTKAGWNN